MTTIAACAVWFAVGLMLGRFIRRSRAPRADAGAAGTVVMRDIKAGGNVIAIAKARSEVDQ